MAMQRAMMYAGAWNIDMLRYAQNGCRRRLSRRVLLRALAASHGG